MEIFDIPVKVAGNPYSLNDMEHRVIRGKVNSKNKKGPIAGVTLKKRDPRIHFALVCAALDCPKLRGFAYTAENLEETLQENAVHFANSPIHVSIEGGNLRLSSILKWFREDFDAVGGVVPYLESLIDPEKRSDAEEVLRLLKTRFRRAKYAYDWTVNGIQYK